MRHEISLPSTFRVYQKEEKHAFAKTSEPRRLSNSTFDYLRTRIELLTRTIEFRSSRFE